MNSTAKTIAVSTAAAFVFITTTERHEGVRQHLPTAAAGQVTLSSNSSMSVSTTVLSTTDEADYAVEKVDPAQTIG